MAISLGVKIWGDIGPLLTELKKAEKSLAKFSRSAEKIGKDLAQGLTVPIIGFGVVAVKNFAESENAAASLSAQLRANGKDVEATMKKYTAFANEMQSLTTYEDDAVKGFLQLAESMQAPDAEKATKDAIGLSKAFGVEMPAAIKMAVQAQNGQYTMLGKLNPAIKAAKTDSEKAAIAQKMFADSFQVAAAQAKVGLGPMQQISNQIGNMSEEFGKIVVSYITPFVSKIKDVMTWLNSLSDSTKKTIVNVALFAASIGPVILAVGKLASVSGSLISIFGNLTIAFKSVQAFLTANPWVLLAAAIAAVGTALYFHATRLSAAERAQKALNDINKEALKDSSQQRQAAIQLFEAAKNENLSKDQRMKAIKELNGLSPKYLSGLSLEKIGTDEARVAMEKYTNSLLAKAKVEIAATKLAELAIKKEQVLKGLSDDVDPTAWQTIVNVITSLGFAASYYSKQIISTAKNTKDEIAAISAEEDVYNKIIAENASLVESSTKANTGLTGSLNNGTQGINEQKGAYDKLKNEISELEAQLLNEITAQDANARSTADLLEKKKQLANAIKDQYEAMLTLTRIPTIKAQEVGVSFNVGSPSMPPPGQMQQVPNPFPTSIGVDSTTTVDQIDAIGEALDNIKSNNLGSFFESFKNAMSGIANFAKQAANGFKEGWSSAASALLGVVSSIATGITDLLIGEHQKQIQSNDEMYAREKDNIENSRMNQEQKTAAIERLDKSYEKKRKALMREQAKDQKAAALIQAVIAGALAVVTALSAGPVTGIVLAAIVGALAAVQIGMIASQPLPALAGGGLAFAPTMAVVGDNPNARVDPEVISPLSKLKSMMKGAQDVTVYGVLRGSDIYLSSEKGGLKLARITG